MTDAQIFQVLGFIYLACGLGMLINPNFYKKIFAEYVERMPALYLNGAVLVLLGYLLITFHNVWTATWGLIITIIGWIAFVKGLFALIFPKAFISIAGAMIKRRSTLMIAAIVASLLGILLLVLGYFVY